MFQLLQSLAGITGLLLGGLYLLGGLIVTLYLSRYAITDYQIVRAKYLVVGLVYLFNNFSNIVVAAIPAFFLIAAPRWAQQAAFGINILAFLWVLRGWARPDKVSNLVKRWAWRVWVVLSVLLNTFPLMVAMRLLFAAPNDVYSGGLLVEGGLAIILALAGQVYFYAQHIYGHSDGYDPVGSGKPVSVQLTLSEEAMRPLTDMGLTAVTPTLTASIILIDETTDHYIVGLPLDDDIRALKIQKENVQAILYLGYDSPASSPPPDEPESE